MTAQAILSGPPGTSAMPAKGDTYRYPERVPNALDTLSRPSGSGHGSGADTRQAGAPSVEVRGGNRPLATDTAPSGLLHVAAHRRRPGKQHHVPVMRCNDKQRLAWCKHFNLETPSSLMVGDDTVKQTRKEEAMQTYTKDEARARYEIAMRPGRDRNPESVALSDAISSKPEVLEALKSLEVGSWISLDPADLGLSVFPADVTTNKDGKVKHSRDTFAAHTKSAIAFSGVNDRTVAWEKLSASKGSELVVKAVKHREPKEVEQEVVES